MLAAGALAAAADGLGAIVAAAEQQQENDDDPPAVATIETIVTTHNCYLQIIFSERFAAHSMLFRR